jgi:signal peptidase I
MAPTIKPGEKVRIDYSAYIVGAPKRWDVVAFEPPMFTNQVWLMRVVALPGENLVITNGTLWLNGAPAEIPPHIRHIKYVEQGRFGVNSNYNLGADSYFVLGDNSTNANDSRYWGALPRSNIVGRVRNK